MTSFFLHIYDRLAERKGFAICALGVLIALCLALALRLNYQEDISAFLPQDEESAKYTSVYNNLGGQNKVAVIFRSDKTDEEERLADLKMAMSSFGEILENDTSGTICNLQVQLDETRIFDMLSFVWEHYPYLITEQEYVGIDSLLADSAFVAKQFDTNRQMLMLPTSGTLSRSMPHDPLHLSVRAASDLQKAKVGDAFCVVDGFIFTNTYDTGLIYFESPYGISESKQNAQLASVLDDAIEQFQRDNGDIDVAISAIGGPLIAVTNAQQIKHDSMLAVCLAVVLIMLVLVYSFRRFCDIFWIGTSIAVGWLFAIGCISLLKDGISMIVVGIGSVIIGIAVNYPLHFVDHMKHVSDKRNVLKEMVQPLLIGNITTVSAFLCLVLLDAEAMRDLGLFGSLVLVGTILFVLIFLPLLAKSRKDAGRANYFVLPHFNMNVGASVRKRLLLLMVVATAFMSWLSLRTSFDSDMQHINYMTDSQREDLQVLTSSLEANDSTQLLYVVAEGESMEEALQKNESIIGAVEALDGVSNVSGIGRYVPSKKRQAEIKERWTDLWKNHPEIKEQIGVASVNEGFNPLAFTPFIEKIDEAFVPQDAEFFTENLPLVTENFLMQDDEGVRVVNFVHIHKRNSAETKQQIRNLVGEHAFAFDATDMGSHLVTLLSDSFNYIGFVCGFVVFFFLWLSFGRIELSMLSFLPLAVSWVWILGIMNLCSIQFNIVNIILATFIFGQGDDYTIFITEGLMYEYAYGKKQVQAYKNSVALSAIIMFIGLGALIVAKHPAMRSLAEVAIVGMLMVVVMAFYLPPMVYKWITTIGGQVREYPLTLKRISYSLFSFCVFLVGAGVCMVTIFFYTLFEKKQAKVSLFIHNILWRFSRLSINRVPGAPFKIVNEVGEDFYRPAVIICNHQSQLDLVAVMSLTTKITILTKDWVWNNPFYGRIIRASEFYPITSGVDSYLDGMKDMVRRGYSIVVFPEGTRSAEGILRFHKGAFLLAQELGVDILPLHLHGLNDVLPRHDFMLREGSMTMEIGRRMPAEQVKSMDAMALRKYFHSLYVERFDSMRKKYETSSYFIPFAQYKYMYKGFDIERATRRILRDRQALSAIIDREYDEKEFYFVDSCQGVVPYIFAKVHRDMNVYADFTDEDEYLVASHLQGLPSNLHISLTPKRQTV